MGVIMQRGVQVQSRQQTDKRGNGGHGVRLDVVLIYDVVALRSFSL